MAAWIPKNFDEAAKRNAGRRKLHMRKRQARADRIVRLLAATDSSHANGSRATHGSISTASQAMEVSKATASRDCNLVRRIHRQFLRMFGRNFDTKRDRVVWTWNWDHYGFITPESPIRSTLFTLTSPIRNQGSLIRLAIALSRLFGRNLLATSSAAILVFTLTMSSYALMMHTGPSNRVAISETIIPAGDGDRVETELITVTSIGFEPTELSRPAGKFLLEVDNRSEIEEVELHLDRQAGGREKSAKVRSTAPEWQGALDLQPGVYILSEASRPGWICRITIISH